MAEELVDTYRKVKSPVLCLYKMDKKKISSYGVPKIKKIEERKYQIEELVEKPESKEAPSSFALVGKYVLTPDIFDYLRKVEECNGEIILANALKEMIKCGKKVFGIATKNKWIECGTKEKWIENFKHFAE